MNFRLLFVILVSICNQGISQNRGMVDSIPLNGFFQNNSMLQQTMLLSRQQQQDLVEQNRQKQLFEKQKQAIAEQEKQLMELKIQKKQQELVLEKKNAEQTARQVQLQSKMREFVKDEEIKSQVNELLINRKWNTYLTILFVLVMAFAVATYYNQRKTKRLNAVISAQKSELEEMGMVKDTLLSVVSHDMRTPVNTLLSFSELVKAGTISEEKMELYLNQISHTLNQTSATMNNLLNWAATQMQGYRTNIIAVDLALVTEEMVEHCADRAEAKKLSVYNEIEIGSMALADKNMVELIVRNMLTNAIKYSSANGKIIFSTRESNGKIIFSVQDEGLGMDAEKMNLFNAPDKKPLKSTMGTAREKGTGLGLLLCKTFASLMQGNIQVAKNNNGNGLVFELTLPLAKISG